VAFTILATARTSLWTIKDFTVENSRREPWPKQSGLLWIAQSSNLVYARELLPWSNGTWKLKLANNIELDVSRERARELKSRIG
jgi:hypothetical protein